MDKYFTEKEIETIISTDKVKNNTKNNTKNNLYTKTECLFKYLSSKKINNENIKKMIIEFPRLLTYSIDFISDNYDNLEKIFNKNINRLIISNPRILSRNKEHIENRIEYLNKFFLDEQTTKKICLKFPTILTIGELNIEISIKNLQEKITDQNKLIYLLKANPNILSFSNKLINQKIDWFYKKGYSKKETAKIITKATSILTMEINEEKKDSNIEQKYKYLQDDLKYNKEEIIAITNSFPIYYTLSLNTIKNRVNNLERLGFNIDTIKHIIYNFPAIISFKTNTLNEKYNYYLQLDILDLVVKNPKYLIQSLELTNARYLYLTRRGIEININNYTKLFFSSKKFKQTYGVDNEELLNKYKEKEGYYEQRRNNKNTNKSRRRIK